MNFSQPKDALAVINQSSKQSVQEFIDRQRKLIQRALLYVVRIHSHNALLDHRYLQYVNNFYKEHLGLDIPIPIITEMFVLYPIEASGVMEDWRTTDARDCLFDMISHYYLNSWWPNIDSGVDDEEWEAAVKKAFELTN